MTPKQHATQIKKLVKKLRKEFTATMPKDSQIVVIEWGLPYLAVNLPNGKEYFFQEAGATDILENAVKLSNDVQLSVEDCVIYLADSWG